MIREESGRRLQYRRSRTEVKGLCQKILANQDGGPGSLTWTKFYRVTGTMSGNFDTRREVQASPTSTKSYRGKGTMSGDFYKLKEWSASLTLTKSYSCKKIMSRILSK